MSPATDDLTPVDQARLATPSGLAIEALRVSRARMAARMLPPAPPARASEGGAPSGWQSLWQAWRGRLGALDDSPLGPVVGTARSLVQGWWQRHPWRATAEAVGEGLRDLAVPAVRRHPIISVVLGAVLAAAVVWWQPWRAGWLQPHVQPLPGRMRSWLWRQTTLLPVQVLIPALLAAWKLAQPNPPPDAVASAGDADARPSDARQFAPGSSASPMAFQDDDRMQTAARATAAPRQAQPASP